MKIVGVTWLQQRRMSEMCNALGVELYTLVTDRRGLARYVELMRRTWRVFKSTRPSAVIAQNPSLMLVVFAVLGRAIFRYRLVVDAHNEAVQPFANRQAWVRWLGRRLLRTADLNIVTNRWLAEIVARAGGKVFTLPDALPCPPLPGAVDVMKYWPATDLRRVVTIASYASDEPIAEVIEAAKQLRGKAQFAFTGNFRACSELVLDRVPDNVRFTGFLNDEEYWNLLHSSDVIVDLTLMDNCLVSGAYEAVAVRKPAVISDNPASRELFGGVASFTDNSAKSIRACIEELLQPPAVFPAERELAVRRMQTDWNRRAAELLSEIDTLKATG
jgi:glycosyltransferase involved in cell wall biosynthesis